MEFLFPTWGRPDLLWTVGLIVIGVVWYLVIQPRKGK